MSKGTCAFVTGMLFLALHGAGRGGDPDHAKALVVKAIKAAGGEAKVAKLKGGTCKAKALIQEGNQQINATIDAAWQGWEQYRFTVALDVNGKAQNVVIVINGDKGWAKDVDRNRVKDAPMDELPMIKSMLAALRMPQMLPALLDKEIKLAALGEIKIDDRAALGVSIAYKGDKQVHLFFDKETGLPAKSEIQLTDRRGMEKKFEFLYRDYKDHNGVKQPTRIATKIDRADVVMELSDLKALGNVEPSVFAAPE